MNNIIPKKSIEIYSKLMSQLPPTKARTAIFQLLAALLGVIAAKIYQKVTVKKDPEVERLEQDLADNKKLLDSYDRIIRNQQKHPQDIPRIAKDPAVLKEQEDQQYAVLRPTVDKLTLDLKSIDERIKHKDHKIAEMRAKLTENSKQNSKDVDLLHDEESRVLSEIDNNNRSHQDTIQKLKQQRDALLNRRDNKQNS